MSQLHVIIHGRVQGIFYRAFVEQAARKLKLTGWVKNNKDGTVEVVAEGSQLVLMGLLEALKKGPTGAKVERVDATYEKETGEFKGFETL